MPPAKFVVDERQDKDDGRNSFSQSAQSTSEGAIDGATDSNLKQTIYPTSEADWSGSTITNGYKRQWNWYWQYVISCIACIQGAYLDDLYTYIKYSLHLRQSKWLTDMAWKCMKWLLATIGWYILLTVSHRCNDHPNKYVFWCLIEFVEDLRHSEDCVVCGRPFTWRKKLLVSRRFGKTLLRDSWIAVPKPGA